VVLGASQGRRSMAERRRQEGAATNTLKAIARVLQARRATSYAPPMRARPRSSGLIYGAGARQINTIRRSEIVRFLDKVEDERGRRWPIVCWPSYRNVQLARQPGR